MSHCLSQQSNWSYHSWSKFFKTPSVWYLNSCFRCFIGYDHPFRTWILKPKHITTIPFSLLFMTHLLHLCTYHNLQFLFVASLLVSFSFFWRECSIRKKVAACAKHFVGDGGTTKGINENNTVIDSHGLMSIHMPAYSDSIVKGVSTVMVSYSSWNGEKMHANRELITGLLKNTLKFKVNFMIQFWCLACFAFNKWKELLTPTQKKKSEIELYQFENSWPNLYPGWTGISIWPWK